MHTAGAPLNDSREEGEEPSTAALLPKHSPEGAQAPLRWGGEGSEFKASPPVQAVTGLYFGCHRLNSAPAHTVPFTTLSHPALLCCLVQVPEKILTSELSSLEAEAFFPGHVLAGLWSAWA